MTMVFLAILFALLSDGINSLFGGGKGMFE